MSGTVLILRPEPGASKTAARARAMGLKPVVAPLFEVRPVPWGAPDPSRYDAIFFTSAHAPLCAGDALRRFERLPSYAVGEATAAAARERGFETVRIGPTDGAAMLDLAAREGVRRALHLCGRDNKPLRHPEMIVEQCVVYAADPVDAMPLIAAGAVVLIHSPRAAEIFAGRIKARASLRLALISQAAAEAAGEGWAAKAVAASPRDEALLEVARRLCQSGAPDAAGAGT